MSLTNWKNRLELFLALQKKPLNYLSLMRYLDLATKEDIKSVFKILLYTRDYKNGLGLREMSRDMMQWLMINFPTYFKKIVPSIPKYGRWDDLYSLFPGKIILENDEETDLEIINFININFCSHIKIIDLEDIKSCQKYIVDFFTNQLLCDNTGVDESENISLAGKWACSEGKSGDVYFGFAETMYKNLGMSPKEYRKLLSKLRKYIGITEYNMCAKKWEVIDYDSVPNKTMSNCRKAFRNHDNIRFHKFLRHKFNSKVFWDNSIPLPSQLISYINDPKKISMQLSQSSSYVTISWNNLFENDFDYPNKIVVIDTSGSMYEDNLNIALSVSLFISQLSKFPFKNMVGNFSDNPEFINIGTDLLDGIKLCKNFEIDEKLNLKQVYEIIFNKLNRHKIKKENCPSELIVFTDQKFCNTNLDIIISKFNKKEYLFPKLIYINLSANSIGFMEISNNILLVNGYLNTKEFFDLLTKEKFFNPLPLLTNHLNYEI